MRDPRLLLVVEDSEECAATLEIALGSIPGTEVRVAGSAEEALAAVALFEIAAIVTDIHLPGISGLELVSRVRRDANLGGIPIIVISGDSASDTEERARAAGASVFFGKPYSPLAVRQKLEALIDAN
jgi:CheY-like chemotaxis protein